MSEQNATSSRDYFFRSNLGEAPSRFLASAVAFSLRIGLRTPADFLRHFPPIDTIAALADAPELRALLLETATGMRRSLAVHKSLESAAADLQLCLEHGQVDPASIVELINPDSIVRQVSADRIWRFVCEDKFWLLDSSNGHSFELAKQLVAHVLERALAEALIAPAEVIRAITPERLARYLPRDLLAPMLTVAFGEAEDGRRLAADTILAISGTAELAEHVPLTAIWREVIVAGVAQPNDFLSSTSGATKVEHSRRPETTPVPPPPPSPSPPPPPPPPAPPSRERGDTDESISIDIFLDEMTAERESEALPGLPPQAPGKSRPTKRRLVRTVARR